MFAVFCVVFRFVAILARCGSARPPIFQTMAGRWSEHQGGDNRSCGWWEAPSSGSQDLQHRSSGWLENDRSGGSCENDRSGGSWKSYWSGWDTDRSGGWLGNYSSGASWHTAAQPAPPIAEFRPVAAAQQPAVAEPRPAVVEQQPAVAEPRPAVVEQQPAVAEPCPAVVEQQLAVARPLAVGPIFDIEYFRGFRRFTGGYKQHNAALKYFRAKQENPDDPGASPHLDFPPEGPTAVAVIKHADKGMAWEFSQDEWTEWFWHEMIAQLDDASMRTVVTGPDGRSRGLTGCSFVIRPNSYDHQRHHMMKVTTGNPGTTKLPHWDFVVCRADGSAIRLHPEWSKPHVASFESEGHTEEVTPPRAGLGRSDGRGTYRHYKTVGCAQKLRFDGGKRP